MGLIRSRSSEMDLGWPISANVAVNRTLGWAS